MGSKQAEKVLSWVRATEMLTAGCQSSDRLHLVLARTWQVLPREIFRRLNAREGGVNE